MGDHSDNRFVAHFDILGMRSLTKRDPDLAWQKLSALSIARKERLSLGIRRLDTGEFILDQVRSFTFSDTIIAFSKSEATNRHRKPIPHIIRDPPVNLMEPYLLQIPSSLTCRLPYKKATFLFLHFIYPFIFFSYWKQIASACRDFAQYAPKNYE